MGGLDPLIITARSFSAAFVRVSVCFSDTTIIQNVLMEKID